jgi:hypothetical protein
MMKRPSLRYRITCLTAMLGGAAYPASAQTTVFLASTDQETTTVKFTVL